MDFSWVIDWLAYTGVAYVAYRLFRTPKPKHHTNNRGTF